MRIKKISELGISPWPWAINHIGNVRDNIADTVCRLGNVLDAKSNARLIAASPELYECLHEAFLVQCGMCMFKPCLKEKCAFKNWRDALAKAGGESEAK